MKYFRAITLLLSTLSATQLYAQDLDEMLASTQQIIFVDSVVVDKADFLNAYRLTSDAGSLMTFSQFFKNDAEPYSIVYQNQLGNKCYFGQNGSLYTADMIGNQWSKPTPLTGLGDFQRMNYPFMLSDGTTFYFAAIGDDGLGGLDIYMSRYNVEDGSFLKAENIGMPFNSEANDYMYAVNEMDSIGYFATDRRQPEGKVCIYTFIPNQSRRVYSSDDFSEDVIRSRAAINSIADTWGDGKARERALLRIQQLSNGQARTGIAQTGILFVVDDQHVYTAATQFRNTDNRERFKQLLDMKQKHQKLETELEKARRYYAKASGEERPSLKSEILDYELDYIQQQTAIHEFEKLIRQTEIPYLQP